MSELSAGTFSPGNGVLGLNALRKSVWLWMTSMQLSFGSRAEGRGEKIGG